MVTIGATGATESTVKVRTVPGLTLPARSVTSTVIVCVASVKGRDRVQSPLTSIGALPRRLTP
jgi:hypothetical protein